MSGSTPWRFGRACLLLALSVAAAGAPTGAAAAAEADAPGPLVYVGTYTDKGSRGIYLFALDAASGALSPRGLAAETANPSFLAVHPSGRFVYAVNELDEFQHAPTGAASAFAVEAASGRLTLLNQQPSGGAGPCHLAVDAAGRNLLVANYGGGSVAVLPIGEEGRLGPVADLARHRGRGLEPRRQGAPHAHGVYLLADEWLSPSSRAEPGPADPRKLHSYWRGPTNRIEGRCRQKSHVFLLANVAVPALA